MALRSFLWAPFFLATATIPLASTVAAEGGTPPLHVDADFPGGNIIVEQIEDNVLQLRPDLRDTSTWWFYWNFRVPNAAGRTFSVRFSSRNPIGVRGPAASYDGGKTWKWLGEACVTGKSFNAVCPANAEEVRFAFAMPYQQADWDRFAKRLAARRGSEVKQETLCDSAEGRQVPLLRVVPPTGEAQRQVLVTARHHACETMGSYVLEGLVDGWLASHAGQRRATNDVELNVVPFVDLDGVENGEQGKNRKPRDHNRDYDERSLYPETKAIKNLVASWTGGPLRVAIDLHCPWIRGPHNEVIYMVGSADKSIAKEQERFARILQRVSSGPLPYDASDNLAFGTAWNTDKNYEQGTSFSRWAGRQSGIEMAASFEIPYANAGGKPVTPDSARAFGRDLAAALVAYLQR